ncbi:hypothetical protein [Streptomyces zhihengii]|uniref:Uncharacterized protein n=1 Tax=Streptomyces zhihengii TaxID=1818004 RepID=A0ABS2UZ69_9ACTN|nr:hypothetical protein [Streptomyces zhihengii]MBM9622851.1 hypothetical protein [Streptomyces zhihengii]
MQRTKTTVALLIGLAAWTTTGGVPVPAAPPPPSPAPAPAATTPAEGDPQLLPGPARDALETALRTGAPRGTHGAEVRR